MSSLCSQESSSPPQRVPSTPKLKITRNTFSPVVPEVVNYPGFDHNHKENEHINESSSGLGSQINRPRGVNYQHSPAISSQHSPSVDLQYHFPRCHNFCVYHHSPAISSQHSPSVPEVPFSARSTQLSSNSRNSGDASDSQQMTEFPIISSQQMPESPIISSQQMPESPIITSCCVIGLRKNSDVDNESNLSFQSSEHRNISQRELRTDNAKVSTGNDVQKRRILHVKFENASDYAFDDSEILFT